MVGKVPHLHFLSLALLLAATEATSVAVGVVVVVLLLVVLSTNPIFPVFPLPLPEGALAQTSAELSVRLPVFALTP